MTSPSKKFKRVAKPRLTPEFMAQKLIKYSFVYGYSVKTAIALVGQGVDVTAVDVHGQTALMGCASKQSDLHMDLARVLIAKGAPLDALSKMGQTALIRSIGNGNSAMALLLLESGCQTDICDRQGKTALHIAAEQGRVEMVKALLAHGANIDAKDHNGNTPINLVTRSGYSKDIVLPTAVVLIEAGCDYTIVNNQGLKPYDYTDSPQNGYGPRFPEIRQMIIDQIALVKKRKLDSILNAVTTSHQVNKPKPNFKPRKK